MPAENYQATHNRLSQEWPQPVVLDRQVAQATHIAEPKTDVAPFNEFLNSLPDRLPKVNQIDQPFANFKGDQFKPADQSAEQLPTLKTFDRERFQKLLKHLGINTCIVMCFGVGFILIAKLWVKGKHPKKSRTSDTTIQIRSTLKLSPKSSLFLVQTGEHRLLVASNQNGIKSVVKLTDSFSQTLDSISEIADEAAYEPDDSKRDPMAANDAGLYSLASVGKSGARPKSKSGNDRSDAEVRRLMEKALSEHGLKDLFLKKMESRK